MLDESDAEEIEKRKSELASGKAEYEKAQCVVTVYASYDTRERLRLMRSKTGLSINQFCVKAIKDRLEQMENRDAV